MQHNSLTNIKNANKLECLKFVKINSIATSDDDIEDNNSNTINIPAINNPSILSARVEVIDEINFDEIVVEHEFTKINDKIEHLNNIDKSFL